MIARVTHVLDKGDNNFLGTDISVNMTMRQAMYGVYHHIGVYGKEVEPEEEGQILVGRLAEDNDRLTDGSQPLPKLEVGDIIFMWGTGAHSLYAMSSNHNGITLPGAFIKRPDGKYEPAVRPQTIEDYIKERRGKNYSGNRGDVDFKYLDVDPLEFTKMVGQFLLKCINNNTITLESASKVLDRLPTLRTINAVKRELSACIKDVDLDEERELVAGDDGSSVIIDDSTLCDVTFGPVAPIQAPDYFKKSSDEEKEKATER